MGQTPSHDPRPEVRKRPGGYIVLGCRCEACGYVAAYARPHCPDCRGAITRAEYGPLGRVWSSTTVRVPVPGLDPPYHLAYIDIDNGPRILAHVAAAAPAIGARVCLTAPDAAGNPRVRTA